MATASTAQQATVTTITVPGGAVAGEQAVIVWQQSNGGAAVTIGGTSTGWTTRIDVGHNGNVQRTTIVEKILDAGDIGNTVTFTTAANRHTQAAFYSEADVAWDDISGVNASGTPATSLPYNAVSPAADDATILAVCCARNNATGADVAHTTAPTSYAEQVEAASSAGALNRGCIAISTRVLSGGAGSPETPSNSTVSASSTRADYTISLVPAAVDLVVQDATQAQTADNVAIGVDLTVQDAAQAQASGTPTLTQLHELVAQAATHAQTADNVALVVDLAVQAAAQAMTSGSPVLTQLHDLAVQGAAQAMTSDSPALAQLHQLAVSDAHHGHTAELVQLSDPQQNVTPPRGLGRTGPDSGVTPPRDIP